MNPPPISIEALMVLDAIEYRGSYAAAAEQLNKVPSALSYIVQKLEEQLNVTLFVRQGRRAVLTPAGQHLLVEGRKVLSSINVLSEQTQTIANGWEPKIRIACDSIVDINAVFKNINGFLTAHKNIEIDVQEGVMNGTWEALIHDNVDLVIGAPSPIPNQKGIRAIKAGQFDGVLVAAKTHELSTFSQKQTNIQQPISAEELIKYRSIVVHDSSQHEIPWSANMIEGTQHFYVSSVAQKLAAIKAGIGMGYLPKYMVQHAIDSGQLVVIDTDNKLVPQDLYIAWKIANKGKGLQKLIAILSKTGKLN
jgi:DNA-binding transcriptional LysR family regulator